MRVLAALVIKDLQANKKSLMIPIWFLLGSYVLLAFTMIVTSATGRGNMAFSFIPPEWLQNANIQKMMSFIMQIVVFFSFYGLVFAISMALLSSTMLNQDIKHKCELFHRSQPVSILKITTSRYIAGIGGPLGLAFIIGIINMLLSISLVSIFTPMHVNMWMSLNGFMLSWLHFCVAMMVFGSILFVFSAIFKENAFGLGLCGFGVLHILAFILNKIYGWKVPLMLNELYKLIMSGILKVQLSFPSMEEFGITSVRPGGEGFDLSKFAIPHSFLPNLWATLFTGEIAFKLFFCVCMFVLAYYIYQKREVQF
jgi:hypothetical protein